jgi:hypothetical protein
MMLSAFIRAMISISFYVNIYDGVDKSCVYYKSSQKSLVLPLYVTFLCSNYVNSLVIICSPNEKEVTLVGIEILNINKLVLE